MYDENHDAELEGDKGRIMLFWSEEDARREYQAYKREAKSVNGTVRGWSIQQIKIKAGGVTVERWAVTYNSDRARS